VHHLALFMVFLLVSIPAQATEWVYQENFTKRPVLFHAFHARPSRLVIGASF
jgi:hypothetical protein